MRVPFISFTFLFSLSLLVPFPLQATQTILLDPDKRLELAICPDSMNRIAVEGDRITHVFGDDGAFESQHNENTGQVFLKPTAENGEKPISITLVTEQGATQDLTLKPASRSATTLVLKSRDAALVSKPGRISNHNGLTPFLGRLDSAPFEASTFQNYSPERTSSHQGRLLAVLKQAVTGQLPLQAMSGTDMEGTRPNPDGFELSPHQTFTTAPYIVHTFHVTNATSTSIEVQEKDFYQPGDLALSLHKRVLPPQDKTILYVVKILPLASKGPAHG